MKQKRVKDTITLNLELPKDVYKIVQKEQTRVKEEKCIGKYSLEAAAIKILKDSVKEG